MSHKFADRMKPGHGLGQLHDEWFEVMRPEHNYMLPDGSSMYTHRNGHVFLTDFCLSKHYEISRSIAAMLLYGVRHGDKATFSNNSSVLRWQG